ncbi:unnamed protein product [Didymodactylos carnosus]|nr:unnamed protein product [Didymodactylos carnosus]CAF4650094.1 unnamed protein product [Didymodactylos carnosus]
MGAAGGASVNMFLLVKKRFFHFDDTLDVFTCHGLGGAVGTFMTGLFCQNLVNNSVNGAFYGYPIQIWYQTLGILVTVVYSITCTLVILIPMHVIIGIKIKRRDQIRGIDNVAHGENWQIEVISTSSNTKTRKPKQQTNNPVTIS